MSRVLIARSSPECHLYIELHPCPCGERRLQSKHDLLSVDDGLLAVYQGTCRGCGFRRRFEFLLDPELPPGDKFGASRPSRIIDAGQYLAVADEAAARVPADVSSLDATAKRNARAAMNRAINALEEVFKWGHLDDGSITPDAFFTETGQSLFQREPGRLHKTRLDAVLETYGAIMSELKR